eukprot:1827322-Pyramimonas_sp.AAC.1
MGGKLEFEDPAGAKRVLFVLPESPRRVVCAVDDRKNARRNPGAGRGPMGRGRRPRAASVDIARQGKSEGA